MDSPAPAAQAGPFKVLYFAAAQSYTHRESETLSAPLTITQLFEILEKKYEGIGQKVLGHCKIAVNWEYVDLESEMELVIKAGDEVGVIPPVSSG